MFFLGHSFCSGRHCADTAPANLPKLKRVRAQNCLIDTLYLTKDCSDKTGQSIPAVSDWDFDTLLNARFEGNLLGGNVNFTADQIRCIRIKRAEADSYRWLTLFEIPIDSNDDLSFTRVDRTARGSQKYKYALVPVWNDNIEGNYNVNTVVSDFDGVWIAEKDTSVHALLNLEVNTTRNIVTSTVTPLGRKYPYVNQYGDTNYTSGELEATFIGFSPYGVDGGSAAGGNPIGGRTAGASSTGGHATDASLSDRRTTGASPSGERASGVSPATADWDLADAVKYRELVEQFLTNGCPKIIKHFDGRIWLACISDSVPKNESSHYQMPVQTVTFTEIGNWESSDDLYHANLIDVNIEGGAANHGILSYAV